MIVGVAPVIQKIHTALSPNMDVAETVSCCAITVAIATTSTGMAVSAKLNSRTCRFCFILQSYKRPIQPHNTKSAWCLVNHSGLYVWINSGRLMDCGRRKEALVSSWVYTPPTSYIPPGTVCVISMLNDVLKSVFNVSHIFAKNCTQPYNPWFWGQNGQHLKAPFMLITTVQARVSYLVHSPR